MGIILPYTCKLLSLEFKVSCSHLLHLLVVTQENTLLPLHFETLITVFYFSPPFSETRPTKCSCAGCSLHKGIWPMATGAKTYFIFSLPLWAVGSSERLILLEQGLTFSHLHKGTVWTPLMLAASGLARQGAGVQVLK